MALIWKIPCDRAITLVEIAVREIDCVCQLALLPVCTHCDNYVVDDHVALYFGDPSLLTRRALLCRFLQQLGGLWHRKHMRTKMINISRR